MKPKPDPNHPERGLKIVHTDEDPCIRPVNKARLSIVETVYYQHPEDQPVTLDHRFGRWVDSTDEPYLRKFKVGTEWQSLPKLAGAVWIGATDVGLLCIKNEEGRFLIEPTPAQKEEAAQRIVCIEFGTHGVADIFIPPGESVHFQPVDLNNVYVRCWKGEAKFTLSLFPK